MKMLFCFKSSKNLCLHPSSPSVHVNIVAFTVQMNLIWYKTGCRSEYHQEVEIKKTKNRLKVMLMH